MLHQWFEEKNAPKISQWFKTKSSQNIEEKVYQKLKSIMLFHLEKTKLRCEILCDKVMNQERHISMAIVPSVEAKKVILAVSYQRVLDTLDAIESCNFSDPRQKISRLLFYGKGLANPELEFNGLFMTIFAGKIRKRWVPIAKTLNTCLKNNKTNIPESSEESSNNTLTK